jgi:predicted MFS family arabinose efflux permease
VWLVRKSLYWAMFLTIFATAAGSLVILAAGPMYGLALTGQCIVGATNLITLTASLSLPAEWFPPELQVRSITIAGMSNIVGMGLGMFVSVYTSIPTYSLIMACISCFCLLAFLPTGRVSPKKQEFTTTFKETLTIIRKDSSLIAVIFLASTIIGVIYTYIGLLSAILEPEGLSTQDIGLSGGFFVVSGMLGNSISSWLGETKGIAFSLRSFLVPSMILFIGLVFSTSDFAAFSVLNVAGGFFIQGTMTIGLAAISYNSYPADESIVSCIAYITANLTSLVANYAVIFISEVTGLSSLLLLVIINTAVSLPLLIILRLKSRKEDLEGSIKTMLVEVNQD